MMMMMISDDRVGIMS